jgi:hypothetical protein
LIVIKGEEQINYLLADEEHEQVVHGLAWACAKLREEWSEAYDANFRLLRILCENRWDPQDLVDKKRPLV